MVRFTARQLEYFVSVSREGGIAQAARKMNTSAAAIAAAISKLEEQIGVVLFDRFPARGLVLTRKGSVFLEDAEQVLFQINALGTKANALAATETGKINFGCYYSLALIFAAPILSTHMEQWPNVLISVTEDIMPRLRQNASDKELDVILAYEDSKIRKTMEAETLYQVKPRVILPASHPLANLKSIPVEALNDIPYIRLEEPDSTPNYISMIHNYDVHPKTTLDVKSFELARSCVGKGMGFTLMAFAPPNDASYQGQKLKAVPIKEDIGTVSLCLFWRPKRGANDQIERFVNLCRSTVALGMP
jgi:DNA-binding transcriptional LysR family regulator